MNPRNAIIENCSLLMSQDFRSHVVIEIQLRLQGCGGTTLSIYCGHGEKSANQLGYAIKCLFDITETYDFSKMKGKPVRARFANDGRPGDEIIGIGHFMEEVWLVPKEERLWQH